MFSFIHISTSFPCTCVQQAVVQMYHMEFQSFLKVNNNNFKKPTPLSLCNLNVIRPCGVAEHTLSCNSSQHLLLQCRYSAHAAAPCLSRTDHRPCLLRYCSVATLV